MLLLCCSNIPLVLQTRTHGDVYERPLEPFWRWCDLIWCPLPSWQTSCTGCRLKWGQCPQWPAVYYRCCGLSRTSCDSVMRAEKVFSEVPMVSHTGLVGLRQNTWLHAHLFIVSKCEVEKHVLFQKSSNGTFVDVSCFITEQLWIIHVLRQEKQKFQELRDIWN